MGDDPFAHVRPMKYREQLKFRRIIIAACVAVVALLGALRWWDRNRGWVRACEHQEEPLEADQVSKIFDDNAESSAHTLGQDASGKPVPLFRLAMFGMDSEADYWDLVKAYTGRLHIKPGDSVFESGCGTGAFLQALNMLYGSSAAPLKLSGIDFSEKALDVARNALRREDATVGERLVQGVVQNLTGVPSNAYDVVVSFSVFGYLRSEQDAVAAVDEMLRIAKPGGRVFIGNINDAAKLGYADCMGTQRMFFPKSLWTRYGAERVGKVLDLEVIDGYDVWHKLVGYDMAARFRYSVYLSKM